MNGSSKERIAALYYRGKAKYAKRDRKGGRADHRRVLKEAPDSWYSVVLRSRYRRRVKDAKQLALADAADPSAIDVNASVNESLE